MSETWIMAVDSGQHDKISLIEVVTQGGDVFNTFLVSFDPDGNDGHGTVRLTDNIDHAKRFDSFAAVLEEWKRQSTARPIRDDGKPNRPLTAWSIQPRRL
jgi:hypothetical protein